MCFSVNSLDPQINVNSKLNTLQTSDGEFRKYGFEVASMMEDNPEDRVDPMARIFPKVTTICVQGH